MRKGIKKLNTIKKLYLTILYRTLHSKENACSFQAHENIYKNCPLNRTGAGLNKHQIIGFM